jgi:hypothetical protein
MIYTSHITLPDGIQYVWRAEWNARNTYRNWAEKYFAKWLILTVFGISTVEPSGSFIKDLVNVISVDFFQRYQS